MEGGKEDERGKEEMMEGSAGRVRKGADRVIMQAILELN